MSALPNRAVLFDLDGTLLHTAPDLAGALNDMRAARGLEPLPLARLAPMCSYGGRGMLAEGLGLTPDDADYRAAYDDFIESYRQRMTRGSHPYYGVRELLAALVDDGWAWGVVTNKSERLAKPLLSYTAFEPAPGCIIGGDSAGAAKPDPAPLLLACDRIGIDPGRCIYVGDSDRDIDAAHAAGMPAIAAGYGYVPVGDDIHAWRAEAVVDSVAELYDAVERLRRSAIPG